MTLMIWIVGLLTGGLVVKFFPVLKKMAWYFWVLFILWYGLGVFGAAMSQTSFAEGEPQAGMMSLALFGAIFVVLGVIIYIFGIKKAKSKTRGKLQEKPVA